MTPPTPGSLTLIAPTWEHAVLSLLGGVALLLFGLDKMTGAFKALSGDTLRPILTRFTHHRLAAFGTGAGVTALVQSGTATTLLVMGLLTAKLIEMPAALAVVLGADVGTTLTVQLIAFRLNQYALLPIFIGFVLRSLQKSGPVWNAGRLLMALGFVFFGVFLIGESSHFFYQVPQAQSILVNLTSNPLIGLATGTLCAALLHSSAATLAVLIALCSRGLLTLDQALPVMLGANLGTGLSAALASLTKGPEAKRIALAHIGFKLAGVLLILPFLPLLISAFPPSAAQATPRDIANTHTLFNLAVAGVFLPFIYPLSRLITRAIPERRHRMRSGSTLSPTLLETPPLALTAAREEVIHLLHFTENLSYQAAEALHSREKPVFSALVLQEKEADTLYRNIVTYVSSLSGTADLTPHEEKDILLILSLCNHLEELSDILGEEVGESGLKRLRRDILPHEDVITLAQQTLYLFGAHLGACGSALQKGITPPPSPEKADLLSMIHAEKINAAVRLGSHGTPSDSNTLQYALEVELLDILQRSLYHVRKITENLTAQKTEA